VCSRPVVTSRVPGPLRRSAPPDAAPRARRHGGSSRSRAARRRGPRCSCCSCSGAAAPGHAPTLPFSFYLSASVLIRRLSLLRDPPPAPNGRPARSIPFSTLSEWLCAALEPRAEAEAEAVAEPGIAAPIPVEQAVSHKSTVP
jgi:hypothetical protein